MKTVRGWCFTQKSTCWLLRLNFILWFLIIPLTIEEARAKLDMIVVNSHRSTRHTNVRVKREEGRNISCGTASADWTQEASGLTCPDGRETVTSGLFRTPIHGKYLSPLRRKRSFYKPRGKPRITGGYRTNSNMFPSLVKLETEYYKAGKEEIRQCTGVLIESSLVLSTTTCIPVPTKRIKVQLGFGRGYDSIIVDYPKKACVNRANVPRLGNEDLIYENDFALLLLTKPVEHRDDIQTVCMPSEKTKLLPNASLWAAFKDFNRKDLHQSAVQVLDLLDDCTQLERDQLTEIGVNLACYMAGNALEYGSLCTGDLGAPIYALQHCKDPKGGNISGTLHLIGFVIGGNPRNCHDRPERNAFAVSTFLKDPNFVSSFIEGCKESFMITEPPTERSANYKGRKRTHY